MLQALAAYQRSAQQGNVAAELKIGDYYFYGLGTAVNYRSAVAHYRAASEARNAQAMFDLGYMHEHGIGHALTILGKEVNILLVFVFIFSVSTISLFFPFERRTLCVNSSLE